MTTRRRLPAARAAPGKHLLRTSAADAVATTNSSPTRSSRSRGRCLADTSRAWAYRLHRQAIWMRHEAIRWRASPAPTQGKIALLGDLAAAARWQESYRRGRGAICALSALARSASFRRARSSTWAARSSTRARRSARHERLHCAGTPGSSMRSSATAYRSRVGGDDRGGCRASRTGGSAVSRRARPSSPATKSASSPTASRRRRTRGRGASRGGPRDRDPARCAAAWTPASAFARASPSRASP